MSAIISTEEREFINTVVNRVSPNAIKHWLKGQKKVHSFNNRHDLVELLIRLITDQNKGISFDDFVNVSLGIEENGSKSIYLCELKGDISHLTSKKTYETFLLEDKGIRLSDKRILAIATPKKPTLNYVVWLDNKIIAKWSETQYRVGDMDYENLTFAKKPLTKIVVLIADLENRFVRIQMDECTKMHEHRDEQTNRRSSSIYRNFYLSAVKNILGNPRFAKLSGYSLSGVVRRLVDGEPRIIQLVNEHKTTGDNSRLNTSCSKSLDIRDDRIYSAIVRADQGNNRIDEIHFFWLPEMSNELITRQVGMKLARNIEISRFDSDNLETSMIRFNSDCLETEVDYALSMLRQI